MTKEQEAALAYPGAPVMIVAVSRGDEEGDVRVSQYDEKHFRVAMFVPGVVVELPGDTPKVEPEMSQWVESIEAAEPVFLRYLTQAGKLGWTEAA